MENETFNGCKGCKFFRKYGAKKEYFCAAGSRTDGIETYASEKEKSNSVWPFSILKASDIKHCNGYVGEKK